MPQNRQLASIMFTDIVGYTALMGTDENKAFEYLELNRSIQKPVIEEFNGKFIKELGDGILASFNTVSDSIYAAIKIQEKCNSSHKFRLRIGIHLGEVIFENNDVFGDGVNIASRLQAIADPGGIYISESVQHNIVNKPGLSSRFVKKETLKNVQEPVNIYEIRTAAMTESENLKKNASAARPQDKSIAVLPFVNMSNDPEQEYFSDGMAEEILNSLAHLKDLKVAARTSSFQYKGKNSDLREVGRKLGVSTILEGSVRKYSNRLRITAQLIEIENGFHLWSERFDRDMEDVFAIQDEIALAVTTKLKVIFFENDLGQITKMHTRNTEAYQFYLQGRYNWSKRNEEGLNASIHFFKKAIEKDATYSLAWAGLADSYNLIGEYTHVARSEIYPKAKEAALKALEYDSNIAEAHISLASLLMLDEWNWEHAGREFRLGLEMNPNYATGHHWYSEWLMYTGDFKLALKENSLAAGLDPTSMGILKDKGLILYYNREYDKAIELAKVAQELQPGFNALYRLLSLSYMGKQLYDLAIAQNTLWENHSGNGFKATITLAHIHALSGKPEEARKILEGLDENEIRKGKDYRAMAMVYGVLGENDIAFEMLDKSYLYHEQSFCSFKIDPKLDPLRADPRFNQVLKKIGLD